MANAIVLEVLEFVRPIRLQVERIVARRRRSATRSSMAESHVPRGRRRGRRRRAGGPAADPGRSAPAAAAVHEPADQRVRGARRRRARSTSRAELLPAKKSRRGGEHAAGADGPGRGHATTARACRPDVIDRIFSPFFTTKPQGSGLGLAIVRKIVDAHDGRIDVECAAGRRHAVPGHAAGDAAATSCSDSAVGVAAVSAMRESDDMGRILVADDHDSLRRGIVARADRRAPRSRRGAERQRRHREAARRAVRRRAERPQDGRQRRHGRAAHGQVAAPDDAPSS